MIRGLSCSTFAAVTFTRVNLTPQGDLRLQVNLFSTVDFTQFFPGKHLKDFQMAQVEFLEFQDQLKKRVNSNSNLP